MAKKVLINSVLFLAVFGFLALPVFFTEKSQPKMVSLQFPRDEGRQLASVPVSKPMGDCKMAEKWRYRCDENRENCVKDQKISYLDCQKSSGKRK